MAISLGFGVLFATFVILLLVPALYLIVEDVRTALRWAAHVAGGEEPPAADAPMAEAAK